MSQPIQSMILASGRVNLLLPVSLIKEVIRVPLKNLSSPTHKGAIAEFSYQETSCPIFYWGDKLNQLPKTHKIKLAVFCVARTQQALPFAALFLTAAPSMVFLEAHDLSDDRETNTPINGLETSFQGQSLLIPNLERLLEPLSA